MPDRRATCHRIETSRWTAGNLSRPDDDFSVGLATFFQVRRNRSVAFHFGEPLFDLKQKPSESDADPGDAVFVQGVK
jgi:hypothetical protein